MDRNDPALVSEPTDTVQPQPTESVPIGVAGRDVAEDMARAANSRRNWWLGFAVVLPVAVLYMWLFIDRGWIPHDEGTLAQSAERLLAGELPHRDFVHGYTGGLNFVHALAFRVFGVNLLALRYALLIASTGWVVVFYYISTRLTKPLGAVVVTLLAVFWSVPNYPASMPSWYNLFLATAGLACFLKYIDTARLGWVFWAGVTGGLSILVKLHGILFVAAGCLFLMYHIADSDSDAADTDRSAILNILITGVLVLAVAALLAIGIARRNWLDFYQFSLPGFAIVAIVGRKMLGNGGVARRKASLIVRASIVHVVGAALPLVAFGAYYAAMGALDTLLLDVVSVSGRALEGASLPPSAPVALIPMALLVFLIVDFKHAPRLVHVLQNALGLVFVALLVLPLQAVIFEPIIWSSVAEATPVIAAVLAVLLLGGSASMTPPPSARSRLVLTASVAAFCSLVQYPFAAAIYFSYSFPLLLLAIVALLHELTFLRARAVAGLAVGMMLFGALYIAPMKLPGIRGPIVPEEVAALDVPRGGLKIGPNDAASYMQALNLFKQHTSSSVTYAGPDAPDFYFLAGMKNPTPVLFDFQSKDTLFYEHLLGRLDTLGVTAVALRRHVVHSPPLTADVQAAFQAKYPYSQDVGRFTIRWR